MSTVIIAIICLVVLAVVVLLVVNKPFREQLLIKFKGRTDEVMAQDAMTPEGATDYYNNAIRKMEEKYNKANQLYIEVTGKLDSNEKELHMAKKELMKLEQNIIAAIDANNDTDAMTLQMKKETLMVKNESLKSVIEELKESKQHQKEVVDQLAVDLEALKQEKEKTIFELQANNQIIELHESINSVAATNESDRMLEKVREGVNKTREKATGSRIAYETSLDTQERRAEQAAREENARKAIEELKKKRGKL